MIIQIKSSYSGPLSHNLEDGQELFISHSQVTHAYVQKKADENAVARLYLSQGTLHLAPMSQMENVFLQNRPFTEDTVLGNEYLLQIKESILLFEVDGEVVMIMMGLALGYGNTSSLKTVKVKEFTPSQAEDTQPSNGALLRPSVLPGVVNERKTTDEETRKNVEGKPSEREEMSETDILLSESSSMTFGERLKSIPKPEESSKSSKGKLVAFVACMMIVMCAATWFVARRNPVVPQENIKPEVAEKTEPVVPGDNVTALRDNNVLKSADEATAIPAVASVADATVKLEETTSALNEQATSVAVDEQKAEEMQVENGKPVVTLEERLTLARKELEELAKAGDADDAPAELIEDKRFGQDVEWMMASFDKLKVSLRKVQVRELEKQMEVRQRAKNLDVSKFSEEATAEFQKRFKEYTVTKGWGYRNSDIEFSRNVINELKKGQLNPNMVVEDSKSQEYSGPILACILSGKIELADEIARELLKLGADSDACLDRKDGFTYSKAWPIVLAEGGVNRMEGFLLPLLCKQNFYISMFARDKRNMQSEDLATSLIWQKHNLAERDKQGNTPLHLAARLGSAKLVALMLLEGVDVNAMNENGETPLHLAIKYGHMQLEPLLLKEGSDITLKTVKGETVEDVRKIGLFFQSIEKKDYAAVRKALANSMSPNMFCDNGATILQMASRDNDAELVRILLEFNADPDLAGKPYPLEYRPIAWAFREKGLSIVEMLLEKGADPNEDLPSYRGNSLLNVLCNNSYPASGFDKETIMKYLKAFLNAKKPVKLDNYRGPLISVAIENKRDNDFVSLLLEKYESFPVGSDVIAQALFYEYPDSIVEKIIEKKADVNATFTVPNYVRGTSSKPARTGQKTTALWLAVAQNRPKIVKLLLKNGADVDWKDENGKTVKDLPSSTKIHQMLQNPGAMVNASVAESIAANAAQKQAPQDSQSENVKLAVTLEDRLALVQKELRKLGKAIDVDNISLQLIEDKRLGVDVEWTKSMFGKLMVSLRKVQARELEKQLKARRRAKNLDVSKFSKKATADFQKQFKEYTATRRDWGYSGSDIEFSREVVHNLQKGRINPNVEVEDATYPRYSGALLACILSGRIQNADEIARELLKQGADPDVCLSRREMLLGAKTGSVVLAEGGIDRMEGFLLPLLGKPDFFNTLQRFGNSDSESLVAKLICLKHNLKEKDNHGNTPLHVAAKIGAVRLVALMLLEGVDVNATNDAGEIPLHLALRYGHLQLEQLFKQSGVNYSLRTVKGESFEDCRKIGLFFQNIEKKKYLPVRIALKNGMSPDLIGSNNATILQMACKNNDKELVKLLLEFNANVELTGEGSSVEHTPLALAFSEKNLEIFEMLLEKGADPNVNPPGYGGESLQLLPVLCERAYLSFGNDMETGLRWLKALLNAKKPPKLVVNQSRPVIVNALDQKMDNVFVSMLLDKYESFPKGSDVIARALFQGYKDSFVERFIEKGADVNAIFTIPNYTYTWKDSSSVKQPRGGQKTTALWLAVEMNRPKIVELLLKNSADVNWKDENGKTVKELPCSNEIRQMIKSAGAKATEVPANEKRVSEVGTSVKRKYAVVDLSGGPNADKYPVHYTDIAPNLNDDTCRTTELWLRRIPAGTFIMGTPKDEVVRFRSDLDQHEVTLTQDFYIGVFECTQKQWELVMGGNNRSAFKGNCRPVECVSYDNIRGNGTLAGAGWPMYGHAVDATSFMGRLQVKTGLIFDLPTDAQWEYACRAGTTTSLNSGKNLESRQQDTAMDEVGRYKYNQNDGKGGYSEHTKVGSYKANAWGLYDMHGNVWEWCLDWCGWSNSSMTVELDPVGPTSGKYRVIHGGNWKSDASSCHSGFRYDVNNTPSYSNTILGFRITLLP